MSKFILGALAGVALGLLLAPKSGEELRGDLSDQMNDTVERGKSAARELSRRARKLGEQAQDQIREAKDAVS